MRPLFSAAPEAASADIVATGIGVVSAAGGSPDAWFEALEAGQPVAREVRPEGAARAMRACAIESFSLRDFGPFRGVRALSRTAQLATAATAVAGHEASGASSIPHGDRVGVVLSTAFGNLESMVRFDREARRQGPRFVDPMLFPNTVFNAPAGHVSILFGYSALNSTFSAGACGGLHAIAFAVEALRRGEADLVFAGGAEELSYWAWLGTLERAEKGGAQSPGRRPAPDEADSFFPGEGAVMLALERAADAARRGARPLALVAGTAQSFAAASSQSRSIPLGRVAALRGAMRGSELAPGEVGGVWAGARSVSELEREEAPALVEALGRDRDFHMCLVAPVLGDWLGASSALQAAAAVRSLDRQRFPSASPPGISPGESGIVRGLAPREVRVVAVTACDSLGGSAAALFRRVESAVVG